MVKSGYPPNWKELSAKRLRLDGYRCRKCGRKGGRLAVHHRVPLSAGGTNRLSNLETLCSRCHATKHPHLMKRYKQFNKKRKPLIARFGKQIKKKRAPTTGSWRGGSRWR
jgi:5-methylcytosine-specific restriction endonuclease McrA